MCLRWFGMNTKGALGDDANSGKVHMLDRTTIITDTGGGGVQVCYSGVGTSADSYVENDVWMPRM